MAVLLQEEIVSLLLDADWSATFSYPTGSTFSISLTLACKVSHWRSSVEGFVYAFQFIKLDEAMRRTLWQLFAGAQRLAMASVPSVIGDF
jgi:hypothetical protein